MKTYFVSRHKGAIDWARQKGINVDVLVPHLDTSIVEEYDVVIGTLPIHLAAEVCKKGARYFHLSIDLPPEYRGKELSADEMNKFGARIEEFSVVKL